VPRGFEEKRGKTSKVVTTKKRGDKKSRDLVLEGEKEKGHGGRQEHLWGKIGKQ